MKHLDNAYRLICLSALFALIGNLKSFAQPTYIEHFNNSTTYSGSFGLSSYNGDAFYGREFYNSGTTFFDMTYVNEASTSPVTLATATKYPHPSGFFRSPASSGLALFTANMGAGNLELYTTDGTAAGTQSIFAPGLNPYFALPFKSGANPTFNNNLLLYGWTGLYATDGTAAGTVKLCNPPDGSFGFTELNGKLLFLAEVASSSSNLVDLYAYQNGVVTKLTTSALPGSASSSKLIGRIGNNVYYFLRHGATSPDSTRILKTDGTTCSVIKSLPVCKDLVIYNNSFIYSRSNYTPPGRYLCVADANMQNEVVLKRGEVDWAWTNNMIAASSGVYFWGDEKGGTIGSVYGMELWRTDGTAAGTYMVKDISAGDKSAQYNSLNPPMFEFCGQFFFAANDTTHGDQLWVTDGTEANTHIFYEFHSDKAQPKYFEVAGSDGKLYMKVNDTLWRFDVCNPLSVVPVSSVASVNVYPNPATNELTVQGLPETALFVTATGIFGTAYRLAVNNNKIDISQLANGYYMVTITDKQGKQYRQKIAVQR